MESLTIGNEERAKEWKARLTDHGVGRERRVLDVRGGVE